jgi:hypothetical protein
LPTATKVLLANMILFKVLVDGCKLDQCNAVSQVFVGLLLNR